MTSSRVVLVAATLLALAFAPRAPAQDVLAPELRAAIAAAAPGARLEACVVMAAQMGPAELAPVTRGLSRRQRAAAVAQALKAHARTTQAVARAVLDAAVAAGRAELRSVLWAGNALLVRAEGPVLAALARVPGVDRIRPIRALTPAQVQDAPPAPVAAPSPAAAAAAPALAPPAPLGGGTAPYPFFDDFESGSLGPDWSVQTTGAGYVAVTADNGPTGAFHVNMASSTNSTPSTASMTVVLDLTGQTAVGIRFKHKEYGDESDPEDGIFVSDDGVTFTQALWLNDGTADYQTRWIDLDSLLPLLGVSYTSTFHVRFQWADNFPIPSDGFAYDDIEIGPGVGGPPVALPEPNLVAQQGPMLWDQGYDGSGLLIGSIDSGANWTHPDLADRIWNNPGEIPGNAIDDDLNGYVDDIHGWDFEQGDNVVTNTDPHGTNCAGLMVGDGTAGRITGMAPGATLVACRVLSEADYWEAQQYLIDLGVDVISSSYSYKWPDRPDYHMFRQIADVELAAGIVHANSIGNQGSQLGLYPIPFNIATPGNCPSPFNHPGQAQAGRSSVIAVGGINWPAGDLYLASGRGPAAWEDLTVYDASFPHAQDSDYWDYPYGGFGGGQPGLVKPDVVAYTSSVMTTGGTGGYIGFTGTSASTPQVGGALCLLLDVQPEALPRHLDAALQLTAADLGAAGKDSVYGAGRIRAWNAARRLLVLPRFDPYEVGLGDPSTLTVFGPPGRLVYGFYNAPIVTNQGDWNLPPGFFFLDVFLMGPSGSGSVPLVVPNAPILQGLTVWFQFGADAPDFSWFGGPWVSVPEGLVID